MLAAHLTGKNRSWLYAHPEERLKPELAEAFQRLVERRASGEPIAHITGTREFWSLPLRVTPDVLIPRPETELLVELALGRLPFDAPCRVADLGTGSGAIALAIASERPAAQVIATDASAAALAVAGDNANRLSLKNVECRRGEWFAPLAGERFDLIVSNPPYVRDDDPHLERGDVRFEPRGALAAGPDGLDAIRVIVAEAPRHLSRGATLILEHGHDQRDAVVAAIKSVDPGANIENHDDGAGVPRVVLTRFVGD